MSSLVKEQLLEDMIISDPRLLSDDWMLIGRQEDTSFGGRIDLLAITPDGSLVLIELKRDKTPREIVAQALDYASWVAKLEPEKIVGIFHRFSNGKNLAAEFEHRFGAPLDEESLNEKHQIIIVAAELDDSSERIVNYLSEREIPINVLCFQVFSLGGDQLLSRTWLRDPTETQVNASTSPSEPGEPWNGEFYCSFGQGPDRSWEDAVEFGFICAGGARWYSRTLGLLDVDSRVWVKIPGSGFVGVGRVIGQVQSASTFKLETPAGELPVLDVAKRAGYHKASESDPDACEYFVRIKWLETVPIGKAIQEVGLFGNQNTVCKPTKAKWRSTVERLKLAFPKYNE
jgi:hypothetical protein